ncbi:hypothetical protein F4814DRAFT_415387 [Daldinia grandis]|nr:hypothetical protein F4814DRAFT_415387 [Daldinia grandis]
MPSRERYFKPIMIILLTEMLHLLTPLVLASLLASASSTRPPSSIPDFTNQPEIRNSGSRYSSVTIEKRQMSEGSSCEGSEGQWNCLTNRWQRCAAGQWSVVMDCAAGTICTPAGLTDDFFVQFANGAAGPSTSDGTRGSETDRVMRWGLVVVVGGMSVMNTLVSG